MDQHWQRFSPKEEIHSYQLVFFFAKNSVRIRCIRLECPERFPATYWLDSNRLQARISECRRPLSSEVISLGLLLKPRELFFSNSSIAHSLLTVFLFQILLRFEKESETFVSVSVSSDLIILTAQETRVGVQATDLTVSYLEIECVKPLKAEVSVLVSIDMPVEEVARDVQFE